MTTTVSSVTHIVDLPCLVRTDSGMYLFGPRNIAGSVTQDLDVSRLDCMVDRGLWLAGRVGNVRSLHQQHMQRRRILITERLDLHLLWHEDAIFIKPLPKWLLDPTFMNEHVMTDAQLAGAANGFLSTYARLIVHLSDFRIAKAEKLLPDDLEWNDWQKLCPEFTVLVNAVMSGTKLCSPRFYFGELRLSRVNMIYRYHPAYKLEHLQRGYYDRSINYQSFLRSNFAWLVTFLAYIALVLTAMQVGLGTNQLKDNASFNNASYCFTVFSILLPLAVLAAVTVVSLGLTIHNVRLTRQHLHKHLPQPKSAQASTV